MKKILFCLLAIGIVSSICAQTDIDIQHKDIAQLKAEIKEQRKAINELREEMHKMIRKTSNAKEYEDTIHQLRKDNDVLQQRVEKIKKQQEQELAHRDATIDSLQNVINQTYFCDFVNRQKNKDAGFYCRAILESPLMEKYNKTNVEYALEMAKLLGYNKKNNISYDIYVDLLMNYEIYYKEFLEVVDQTVKEFDYPSWENREEMLKRYNDRIKKMKYYKVRYTGSYKEDKYIYYLEFQIKEIRSFFTPENYKRENFTDHQKKLQIIQ